MLIDKLRAWEYYYKKLPLYMRNSYGIKEHFEIIWNIMMQLENRQENVLDALNLLQDDYVNDVIAKYDDIDGYDFSFLDMIGSLYGVNRSLNVSYTDNYTHEQVYKKLHLTNKEFYMLIKARIVQNNYDGTFEQARAYYKSIGLPMYMFTGTNPAECYLYLGFNNNVTDNIKHLFMANLLTLRSVGITYIRYQIQIDKMAIWAAKDALANNNNSWDVSVWL